MNFGDEFEELAEVTRKETPPAIDVTASVLATVRAQRDCEVYEFPLWATGRAAAVALAVAILTLIPAIQSFVSLTNPMAALFGTLRNAL